MTERWGSTRSLADLEQYALYADQCLGDLPLPDFQSLSGRSSDHFRVRERILGHVLPWCCRHVTVLGRATKQTQAVAEAAVEPMPR